MYEYVLGLKATNSVMIPPPNSSFIKPITFLLFPLGNGLSTPSFEVSNLSSTSYAISL